MLVPGRDATLGPDAPQSPSPPTLPGGAVALKYQDLASACLYILLLGRRIPIQPPVYVGCGFDEYQTDDGGHLGIDFYKTMGDVYVARSCGFGASGVAGANVYPAFPGCPHQGTTGKAKVIFAGVGGTAIGNCIILEHTDNTHLIWIRTVYMHLDTIAGGIVPGIFVATTDVIGTVGGTGINPFTGRTYAADNNNHLHFEVWEQRAANPGWRTAAEIALMPNTIVRPRAAINPEKYLPPVETEELLHIASPPSPAHLPPLPAIELPGWRPHPQFPADLGYDPTIHTVVEDGYGGYPTWDAIVRKAATASMNVYPFLDAPDGKIYVIMTGLYGIHPCVWLLHSDHNYEKMITTFYFIWKWGGSTITLDVTAGQWIDQGTRIAHVTTVGAAYPFLEWTVLMRVAPWTVTHTPFDLTEVDPYTVYENDSADPSCFLANPGGWVTWPWPGCACL